MSIDNFLSYSVDSRVINHYLRLLVDKNIKTENCNIDLAEKLRLSENSLAVLQQEYFIMQQKLALMEANKVSCFRGVKQDQYGDYVELVLAGVSSRFRWIQPGSFLMGSPTSEPERGRDETQHDVTLTQGFWMADTACTQALWQAVMGNNPAYFSCDLENPVEQVSWDDVQLFLQRANDFVLDGVLRLPSEAEWEYACRAGTNVPFSFGADITPSQVNYDGTQPYAGSVKGLYRAKTIPVKSLPANAWGLYQMHGNVWEWCQDWYGGDSSSASDPKGAESGIYRVLRGGSWHDFAQYVRSAYRTSNLPDNRYSDLGFRLALGQAS